MSGSVENVCLACKNKAEAFVVGTDVPKSLWHQNTAVFDGRNKPQNIQKMGVGDPWADCSEVTRGCKCFVLVAIFYSQTLC